MSLFRTSPVALACALGFILFNTSSAHSSEDLTVPPPWRGSMPMLNRRANWQYEGCYSSSDGLTYNSQNQYQTYDVCGPICSAAGQPIMGFLNGGECWCGDLLPATSDKVDDSNCNTGCFGFGTQKCGGVGFYSVFLTGLKATVDSVDGTSSSSSSSTSTTSGGASSTTSLGATTVVVTAPAQTRTTPPSADTTQPSSSASKPNTAGIAAGVVVGVVLLGAAIAGFIFFMKNKKKRQAEEEYKRNQVADFMHNKSGGGPPQTAFSARSDQRLDPEAGRRNSFGSIADDQDYSRKILRVANPDSD